MLRSCLKSSLKISYDEFSRALLSAKREYGRTSAAPGSPGAYDKAGEKRGFEKGVSEGIAKGREEGRAEGREQNRLDTARKMMADGLPVEKISLYTDISIENLQKLQ